MTKRVLILRVSNYSNGDLNTNSFLLMAPKVEFLQKSEPMKLAFSK